MAQLEHMWPLQQCSQMLVAPLPAMLWQWTLMGAQAALGAPLSAHSGAHLWWQPRHSPIPPERSSQVRTPTSAARKQRTYDSDYSQQETVSHQILSRELLQYPYLSGVSSRRLSHYHIFILEPDQNFLFSTVAKALQNYAAFRKPSSCLPLDINDLHQKVM